MPFPLSGPEVKALSKIGPFNTSKRLSKINKNTIIIIIIIIFFLGFVFYTHNLVP